MRGSLVAAANLLLLLKVRYVSTKLPSRGGQGCIPSTGRSMFSSPRRGHTSRQVSPSTRPSTLPALKQRKMKQKPCPLTKHASRERGTGRPCSRYDHTTKKRVARNKPFAPKPPPPPRSVRPPDRPRPRPSPSHRRPAVEPVHDPEDRLRLLRREVDVAAVAVIDAVAATAAEDRALPGQGRVRVLAVVVLAGNGVSPAVFGAVVFRL